MNNEKEKKKPGRKKKVPENDEILITGTEKNEIIHKKRGRKPKGGKIITTTEKVNDDQIHKQNIILHLKCNMIEIKNVYNVDYIQSYNNNIIPFNSDVIEDKLNINDNNILNNVEKKNDEKDIHNKIKSLASSLHSNIILTKSPIAFGAIASSMDHRIYT